MKAVKARSSKKDMYSSDSSDEESNGKIVPHEAAVETKVHVQESKHHESDKFNAYRQNSNEKLKELEDQFSKGGELTPDELEKKL